MTIEPKFGTKSAYEPAFDQPAYSGEGTDYIICYVPRAGSWLLCDLLRASGRMGIPAEYFNQVVGMPQLAKRLGVTDNNTIPLDEYIHGLKKNRTTPNGMFGVKIEPRQPDPLLKLRAITTHFPNAKFIYVSRKDIVAQGVSYEMAFQTKQWQASPDRREAIFDETRVRKSIETIARLAAEWEVFFSLHDIEPYRLDFESLTADPHAICSEICRFVGVETDHKFSIEKSDFERQGNSVNDDWVRRIKDLAAY